MHSYEEPLLDRDILNENTMSNKALQEELFTLFFDQSKLYIEQLQQAIDTNSTTDWRMTAHGVKGASRSLGFIRLATLALHCEHATPSQADLDRLQKAIGETELCISMADAA